MEQLRACFALSWLLSTAVVCSHFRGGTVSWKHLGQYGDSHKVEIRYSFVWRRDFGTTICDDNAIGSLSSGYSNGAWDMHGVLSYLPANETTAIICTAYDAQENWTYGHNSFITTVTVSGPFHVRYGSGTWMGNVTYADGNCVLKAGNVDLQQRSDTGAVNNPPRTLMMPIVKFMQGCQEDTVIRYKDDDNDTVRCRYAVKGAAPDECAGACNGPESNGYIHFHLNETTCVLRYDGRGATGLFAVALVLEDHPSSHIRLGDSRTASPSNYLSQIPLQFVVQIKHGNSCNERPTYPSQTIQNDEIITVTNCSGMNRTLFAYPGSQSAWIAQFIVIGPQGMIAYPAISHGSRLYSSYLVWTAESCPDGQHAVCYFAMDSGGTFGNQICFTVAVTASSDPCSVNNGGCSDICTLSGMYRTCSCYNPCWNLDMDLSTCVPDMDVACDGESITVSVTDCAINGTLTHQNSSVITTNECQTTYTLIGNREVLKWNVSSCDVTYWVNPVRVMHAGHLWMWYSFDTNSSVIARGEYRKVPVTCSLPWTTEVSASFVPELPFGNESFPIPIEVNLDGFGDLSFYFEFYNTDEYTHATSPADYPISITVNDRFYFAIGAIGRAGLTFFTQDCTAQTSSLDRDRPPLTYTFLRDGCFIDTTMLRHESPNPMEDRLSMEAFDFAEKLMAARKYATITLTCRVMICDSANVTTRCQRGCIPKNRKKRSGDGHNEPAAVVGDDLAALPQPNYPESSLQRLTGRFIMIMERDRKDITLAAVDYSVFFWALIAIGLAIFAVMLYVAYRVLSIGTSQPPAGQEKESYYI